MYLKRVNMKLFMLKYRFHDCVDEYFIEAVNITVGRVKLKKLLKDNEVAVGLFEYFKGKKWVERSLEG